MKNSCFMEHSFPRYLHCSHHKFFHRLPKCSLLCVSVPYNNIFPDHLHRTAPPVIVITYPPNVILLFSVTLTDPLYIYSCAYFLSPHWYLSYVRTVFFFLLITAITPACRTIPGRDWTFSRCLLNTLDDWVIFYCGLKNAWDLTSDYFASLLLPCALLDLLGPTYSCLLLSGGTKGQPTSRLSTRHLKFPRLVFSHPSFTLLGLVNLKAP